MGYYHDADSDDYVDLSAAKPGPNVDWSTYCKAIEEARKGLRNMCGSQLKGKDLRREDLKKVDLGGSNLQRADLRGVDLAGSWLKDANLRGADLRGASLAGCEIDDTDFSNADLRGADLATCKGQASFILARVDSSTRLPEGTPEYVFRSLRQD